jgi:hypothetical protein
MPASHDDGDHPPQVQFAAWGEHEVRKLHAELTELDRLVTQAVAPGLARITRTWSSELAKPGASQSTP